MQSLKLILGGIFIVVGLTLAVGMLPDLLEEQKARRAALKSQLLKYDELGSSHESFDEKERHGIGS